MTLDTSLPASGQSVPWLKIALGGACLAAALYVTDLASVLLLPLYYSVVGMPILGLLMILPTLLVFAALAWAASRVLAWPWALAIGLLPLCAWSFVYAPIAQARLLAPALGDGGTLPIFQETDVLAVMDRTGPRHPSKINCTATCVEILRSGQVRAIFLPRFISADENDVHGVIYRARPFGRECHRELAPRGVRPLCVSVIPATLWDVTHVLETYPLPYGDPERVGIHNGEQMRLTHRYSGEVLLQRTAYTARIPSRLPLLGDLRLNETGATVAPRMLTSDVSRPWEHPPLITMLWSRLERRAAGLE